MSKQVCFGDQVYIEISNLQPPPNTEKRLLCSAGFLTEAVYGVKTNDSRHSNFRNCIFTIIPSLVDLKEDSQTINSLRTELSLLSTSKSENIAQKYLSKEIALKEKQIDGSKGTMDSLNQKILNEMDGREVSFGEVILLQHLESGYYLCAESSHHPNNASLHNLKLQEERTPKCYFKFFSYLSPTERTFIDYQSEMKLISVHLNTVVTLGEMKSKIDVAGLTANDDEKRNEEHPFFPDDEIRRDNVLTSFSGEPFAVGTTLESNLNHRIKLVEYCSKEDLTAFTKKRIFKNGDYVRFRVEDFYLTASFHKNEKNQDTPSINLVEQKSEGYKCHYVNSIFQIVRMDGTNEVPKGEEVQSFQKKANAEENIQRYYLKHFATDTYLSVPEEELFTKGSKVAINYPFFSFIHDHSMPQNSLSRNSRVSLKISKSEATTGTYYLESTLEEYLIAQCDLHSKGYIGFRNPAYKIKHKMNSVAKTITGNPNVGSFFQVALVSDDEVRKVLEFESYANTFKYFMRLLQGTIKKNANIIPGIFKSELSKVLAVSEQLKAKTESHNPQIQHIIREFRILDILSRFFYYFLVSQDVVPVLEANQSVMDEIVQLLLNFGTIIIDCMTNNELTYLYVAQYVRMYVDCLLNPSSFYTFCDGKQTEDVKDCLVILLYNLLGDKDLDTLGQLVFYEKALFENLDRQQDFSTHLLKIMNHYFRSECPNLDNTLRDNFIKLYVGDSDRIRKLFPQIRVVRNSGKITDFELQIERENEPSTMLLSTASTQVYNYLTYVFKVIAAASNSRSLKFSQLIMNYYTEDICENLLGATDIPPTLKNSVLSMLKAVHVSYNKLPFDRISQKIQMLLRREVVEKWHIIFGKRIREAENSLISPQELEIVKQTASEHHAAARVSIYRLSVQSIQEGNDQMNRGEFETLPFILQVAKGVLEEEELTEESLCLIYHFLATIVHRVAEEVKKKGAKRNIYDFFLKNADAIFHALAQVDKCVVNFAFKESLDQLKEKLFNFHAQNVTEDNESAPLKRIDQNPIEGTALASLAAPSLESWKTKEMLYQKARRSTEGAYFEDKLRSSLWEIIENTNGELTHKIMSLIKNKINFEESVNEQLSECALMAEENEINNFDQLVTSLLNLNRIERKLHLITEFELSDREGPNTLEEIIENLQAIWFCIYDYEAHMKEENKTFTKEKAKEILLSRFILTKVKSAEELPFRYKGQNVKVFYQKIMKTLNAHQILVPYLYHFVSDSVFGRIDPDRLKLANRLLMVVTMLFMYKNPINQNLMSLYPPFINLFYTDAILDSSVEASFMFTEMCKGNKKLLKLNRDYLFSVAVNDFVEEYNRISTATHKPATLNYIRSLSVILSAKIPQDLFDPAKFMMDTFFEFNDIMRKDNQLSLIRRLQMQQSNPLKDIQEEIKSTGMFCSSTKMIEMPILYTMLKELLESEKQFALTEDKEKVLVLQNRFTLDKVTPFLTHENIMFSFELKRLTIETLENIFFQNVYKNINIFTDYDHFKSFASLLFIDAYGYIKHLLPANDEFLLLFDNPIYFGSNECFSAMRKYDHLLEFELSHVGFMEYQSIKLLKQTWKRYIYYIFCDFFGHFILNFKDYMLNSKDKTQSSNSIFEIWLRIVIKLRAIDQSDRVSRARLDNALKNAIVHSEYAHRKDMISSALDIPNNLKLTQGETVKKDITVNEEINNTLEKYIRDQSESQTHHVELNLKAVVLGLGTNEFVLKLLIDMLFRPEVHTRDVVFIIQLLRKVIEAENKGDGDDLKPIYLWNDVSELELVNIRKNQDTLVDLGVVKAIFGLLYDYQKDRTTLKEIILLCIALLYGGNKLVQDAFYEEFKADSDNEIISALTQILEDILGAFIVKEGRKTHQSNLDTLKFIYSFFSDDQKLFFNTTDHRVQMSEAAKDKLVEAYKASQNEVKTQSQWVDNNLLLVILEFFQNLCEGHHFNFQEFLRDQSIVGHSKSSNIPEILRQAYSSYHKYINVNNTEIGVKILDMLTEIQQGASEENIDVLLKKTFISDLCNTLVGFNTDFDLLARGFEFNSSHKVFVEIKLKVLVLLKDLVERSEPACLKKLSRFIDLNALTTTFRDNIIAFHKKRNEVLITDRNFETDEMWDPNLSSAFAINFIFRHLSSEGSPDEFSTEIKDAITATLRDNAKHAEIVNYYLSKFFAKHTGAIEIFQGRTNKLLKIYFPIPPMFAFLKEDTKQEFNDRVDRTNTNSKITDLMDSGRELIGQMYIEYNSRNRLFGINFNNAFTFVRALTNVLSIAVVANDLFGLIYDEEGEGAMYRNEGVNRANDILSSIQAGLAVVLIALWFQTKLGRFLAFKWDEFCEGNVKEMGPISNEILQKLYDREEPTPEMAEAVLKLQGPYSDEWKFVESKVQHRLAYYNFIFMTQSWALRWHIIYLGICIGSIFWSLASAFQLFDIIVRSDTVSRIAMAISRNLRQFFWTFVLLLVTIYIYTMIGFHFLHDRYEDGDIGNYCPDAFACYIANLNFGLRDGGGIADDMKKVKYTETGGGFYFGTTIFDLSFFILIIILMLNLIFGMIIDAFGDLRDEKTTNEEDKANNCFICGLERTEFERFGRFEDHIFKEHNMWQYLAYLIYLNEKAKLFATDFTDIEDYVADRHKKKDLIWIPVGRSLTLERQLAKEEKERKSEIEKFRDDMESSFGKVFEQNKALVLKLEGINGTEKGLNRVKSRQADQKKSFKLGF